LVLRDNYCTFRGSHWRQHTGFATGTAMGKEIAELFLHVLLYPVLEKWSQWIDMALRFVDDGFVLFRGSFTEAQQFVTELQSAHQSVSITYSISATYGIFLDLHVFKDASFAATHRLCSRVHQKASNAYLYLHWRSETPRSTMAGIVKGEIGRYIKRCTLYEHFVLVRVLFFRRLLRRGWPKAFVLKQFLAAPRHSQRAQLLTAREEPDTSFIGEFGQSHLLVLTYTAAAARRNLTRVLHDHLHFLPPLFARHTFRRVWRAQRKLGALIKPKIVYTEETTPPVAADAEVATSGGGVHREEPEQRQPLSSYTPRWRSPENSPVLLLPTPSSTLDAQSDFRSMPNHPLDFESTGALARAPVSLHDTRPDEGPPAES